MAVFKEIFQTPLFAIVLTIGTYLLGCWIRDKARFVLLPPVVFSSLVIGITLTFTDYSYEEYRRGGDIIAMLLGPITVS